jgi:KDO2-lipid IV(A) lauroyltransferase
MPIKRIVIGFGWFVFKPILERLPLKTIYLLADLISVPVYLIAAKKRKEVAEEVMSLYGDRFEQKRIADIVRRSFAIYLKRQAENVLFGSLTKEKVDEITSIEGLENLQKSLDKGKGVILLLSHFGSFLLPLLVLGYRGYDVIQVTGKPLLEKHPLHKKILELRKKEAENLPFSAIQSHTYLRPIVRALNKNAIVVIAFDGRTGSNWVSMRFLNRIAEFSPGPFNLAIKVGATILPTFVVRGKDNKHTIRFEPPMELEKSANYEETLQRNTVKYARIFKKYLLNYPCHFAMTLYSVKKEAEKGLNRPLFID